MVVQTCLQAFLASLDSGDIAGNTTADDDEVLLLYPSVSSAPQYLPIPQYIPEGVA